MIPLEKAVCARLESHGEKFEILVDPDLAVRFRQGEDVPSRRWWQPCMSSRTPRGGRGHRMSRSRKSSRRLIFRDSPRIIRKGEIHLTAEQRRQMIADKRRQVINFIARNAINPQTGLPHPPQRIEMAMDEARVNIDLYKNLDELVKETVKALRPILPIRFEEIRIAVRVPADYAPRAFGEIQSAATIERDEWQKDGSWICIVRIPAGIQGDFYGLVNKITKGQGEVKLLN